MQGMARADEHDDNGAIMPRLQPRIHTRVQCALNDKEFIFGLVERYGSPLNLIFPETIHENIGEFQDVYKKNQLRGKIYYTCKPCKSLALIREAETVDIGIDVSSAGSLQTVMECGWMPNRIGATGPKNKVYLTSALKNDVLLNVDNIDELKQVGELQAGLGLSHKARVTIRVADYGDGKISFVNQSDSAFGIRTKDMHDVFSILTAEQNHISFQGFSWHSSAARDEQRAAAMENLVQLTYAAAGKNLKPSSINIGGGFPIMYADSCRQWADYGLSIKESVLGKIAPQTWNNNGLGYRVDKGVLAGGPIYVDHAPYEAKGEALQKRLDYRLPSFGNARFADIVRDSLLSLAIEPGAAMLDQCGITLGCVAFVKKSARGENLVGLDMNRSNLHSDQYKILTEPLLIPRPGTEDRRTALKGEGVYYMGNLCLAYDMLQYNKTYPPFLPQAGDLVAFINTGPYRMDFTESETLMQPLARKIAVIGGNAIPDEDYKRTI